MRVDLDPQLERDAVMAVMGAHCAGGGTDQLVKALRPFLKKVAELQQKSVEVDLDAKRLKGRLIGDLWECWRMGRDTTREMLEELVEEFVTKAELQPAPRDLVDTKKNLTALCVEKDAQIKELTRQVEDYAVELRIADDKLTDAPAGVSDAKIKAAADELWYGDEYSKADLWETLRHHFQPKPNPPKPQEPQLWGGPYPDHFVSVEEWEPRDDHNDLQVCCENGNQRVAWWFTDRKEWLLSGSRSGRPGGDVELFNVTHFRGLGDLPVGAV